MLCIKMDEKTIDIFIHAKIIKYFYKASKKSQKFYIICWN